jgi:thiol-disulfide isomerase/thioredoxin
VRLDENDPPHSGFDASRVDPSGSFRTASGTSLSGNERNNVFLSHEGRSFEDVSGVSGFDDPADGRSLALLDFDRDGWQDLAVVNANTPLLQVFRNQIAELPGSDAGRRGVLALRFVGGNRSSAPAEGLAPRDGYGAVVEVEVGGATLLREHRAGEGMAAQNSATLRIGLGDAQRVDRVRVRWPSGRVQERVGVPAGSLLTVYEDAGESADGSGFAVAAYEVPGLREKVAARLGTPLEPPRRLALSDGNGSAGPARLRLVTTMATWCATCRGELPQIARLRRAFPPSELELLAVPIDEDDTRSRLEAYEAEHRPAYRLLKDLAPEEVARVKQVVVDELRIDTLPAAILTDADGRVLRTLWHVPSVSQIQALLASMAS